MHYSKIAAVVVVSSSLLFAGCSQQINEEQPVTSEESIQAEQPVGELKNITIDAFKYEFSEERIGVRPGDTISLKLTNSNGLHDFVIDELDVATKQIAEGETDTVTFSIPEDASVGESYEYYCSVGNHRDLGMVGRLVVEKQPE